MKHLPIFTAVIFTAFTALAAHGQNVPDTAKNKKPANQVYEPAPPSSQVFTFVEQMPEFPGGNAAMQQFLGDHIHYPEAAQKAGAEGRVYVSIIIDKEGNVTGPTILREPGQ
jgi:protein TonB